MEYTFTESVSKTKGEKNMDTNDKNGAEHEVKYGGLLACPFCGETNWLAYHHRDGLFDMLHEISCGNCYVYVRDYSKQKVILKWNTRKFNVSNEFPNN